MEMQSGSAKGLRCLQWGLSTHANDGKSANVPEGINNITLYLLALTNTGKVLYWVPGPRSNPGVTGEGKVSPDLCCSYASPKLDS